jgi:hypothetical protein
MEAAIIVTGPAGCGKSHWIQKYAEQKRRALFVCPCRKDRTLRDGRQKLHLWGRRTEPAILWLEGADDLTPEAQAFLRRILETHAPQVQFILECRDSNKLQEPIRSRCNIKRIHSPSFEDLTHTISSIRGINTEEIKEYLLPHEYSYRKVKHCIDLQMYYPEIWKDVIEHRKKEKEVACAANPDRLQEYIKYAYHPENILLKNLNKKNISDYGECLDRSGSLWAFLSYALTSSAPVK